MSQGTDDANRREAADGDCHVEWKKAAAPAERLDLAAVRERLRGAKGPQFWRSLEELAETPQFAEMLQREFPRHAAEWPASDEDGANDPERSGFSRRNFLQLSSASLALAGLTACTKQPLEKIVPYVKQPEEILPGRPLFFATAMPALGYLEPVLAESNMGRPTKIEGNPEHAASLGATSALAQASILSLYDPDRSQSVTELGSARTWNGLQAALKPHLDAQTAIEGVGIRVLTGSTTSPTFKAAWERFQGPYPQAKRHQWEPTGRDNVRAGAKLAFGEYVETRYDFAKAKVVFALDSDVLTQGPGAVRYARDFAAQRKLRGGAGEAADHATLAMNRLYAIETTPTATGSMADHRLALAPDAIASAALALAAACGAAGATAPPLDAETQRFIQVAARDLMAHRGAALVVAGECAAPAVHALVHATNAALGSAGSTVLYGEPLEVEPTDQAASLRALYDDLMAGKVDLLVVSGANPIYDAPADLDFATAIRKASLRLHHGLYQDETAEYCQWHVPEAHYLETWGDGRAYDGTATIQQPLIDPLYAGKSQHELLALLAGQPDAKAMDLVQATWKSNGMSDAAWRKALHDGFVADSAPAAKSVALQGAGVAQAASELAAPKPAAGFTIAFRPDPSVQDGRHANNAWLQELPRPLSKLTWDNALLVAPKTAAEHGLAQRQVVAAKTADGRSLNLPVYIQPGHAEGCATLALGFGRTRAGRVGDGVGAASYRLRSSRNLWTTSAELAATGDDYVLASTQDHYSINDTKLEGGEATRRGIVRVVSLAEYVKNPESVKELGEAPDPKDSIYTPWPYEGYKWGLAVDLNACTGCNACVIACQSENNIPVVGKEQVDKGREMHWIRIDRYYQGDVDRPEMVHQPVMCMQCEQAPCEVVCPVAATSHSAEGLNDMVYNRCVGTRYCSNNCPYKVRRFNFLHWNKIEPNDAYSHPVQKLGRNPDVTVRFRGVMEKCTYCVQRINRVKITAEKEDRPVRDGEIKTACQQACPTQAIVFGNLNDPQAEVVQWKSEHRNYGMLEDLNTRPRTSYLARVTNPNPELAAQSEQEKA